MHLPFARDAYVRVAPFVVFLALLGLRGQVPADGRWGFDPRWLYGVSVLVVGGLLLWWRREYGELAAQNRPTAREASLAVVVGLVVFVAWIGLDAPWLTIDLPAAPPFVAADADGRIDWPLVAVRWTGAALLVPVMEELFWRSFLMRWFEHPRFAAVVPQRVGLRALVLSAFVFVLVHTQWLAAAIAGLAYAWLYVRSGRLWVPVIAHAVSNGALGVWVVATANWRFW